LLEKDEIMTQLEYGTERYTCLFKKVNVLWKGKKVYDNGKKYDEEGLKSGTKDRLKSSIELL